MVINSYVSCLWIVRPKPRQSKANLVNLLKPWLPSPLSELFSFFSMLTVYWERAEVAAPKAMQDIFHRMGTPKHLIGYMPQNSNKKKHAQTQVKQVGLHRNSASGFYFENDWLIFNHQFRQIRKLGKTGHLSYFIQEQEVLF